MPQRTPQDTSAQNRSSRAIFAEGFFVPREPVLEAPLKNRTSAKSLTPSTSEPTIRDHTRSARAHLGSDGAATSPHIEQIAIDDLRPYPANVRTHSKKQIKQVAASIALFGFNGVVVVNAGNMIIAGHGRVEAAKLLGLSHVPCFRLTHLAEAEERAYAIADNKIAINAGWDREALSAELFELSPLLLSLESPVEIDITGFEMGEIDALLADHQDVEQEPVEEPVAQPSEPVTRPGDLWLLGKHRLLCADALDANSYARLLGDAAIGLVICDPPFNVRITGHVGGRGKRKHEEFAFASGEMGKAEFSAFLRTFLEHTIRVCRKGALIFCFMDWRSIGALCAVGEAIGLELINICIWNKPTPGQGSFYRSAHEMIAVFRKPGAASANNIELGRYGRSRTNVWTYASPNKFKKADDLLSGHPTPKPIAMIADAIKDASNRGDIVLDSFLGSGTTILAAEKVGRRGYGIEYEPGYCDLSILRWQQFTGRDAVLATTGQSFSEIWEARCEEPENPTTISPIPTSADGRG